MKDKQFMRLLAHVAAIAGAMSVWWWITDFGAAIVASAVVYFAVSAIANRLFGPMVTADDVRRDVAAVLRNRDRPDAE